MIPNTLKGLDFDLGNDVNLLKSSIQEFCDAEIAPLAQEIDRNNDFPSNLWKKMGNLGLLGSTIQGYDCPGVDYMSYGLVAREIEKIDSGYRSMMSVQSSLVPKAILPGGSRNYGTPSPLSTTMNWTSGTEAKYLRS